jgi:nucleoid-associated protein YgaU
MTRVRAVAALAALLGVLVGMPWALTRFGQWPITGWPDIEHAEGLRDSVVSDSTVFSVLTVAAWLVWGLFVLSFVIEAKAALRGLQAPSLAFVGPVQRAARLLVATVIVGLTIHTSTPRATALPVTLAHDAAGPADAIGAVDTPAPQPPLQPSAPRHETAPPSVITVRAGDSVWSLAEAHLGDGMRWRELWNLNRNVQQQDGRTWSNPQVIEVGWRLQLPSDATAQEAVRSDDGRKVHVVEPGDTLWDIADGELGDPYRYPEIFDLNDDAEDVQPDGRRLEDPDLILPGWELELPNDDPAVAEPPGPLHPDAAGSQPDDPATSTEAASAPPLTSRSSLPPSQTVGSSAETPANADTSDLAPADDTGSSDTAAVAGTLAGVTGALAAGLALRIAVLRRRRSVRGARNSTALSATLTETEGAVLAAADVPLVRWAGQQLARLVASLNRRQVTSGPLAVEVSEEAGIELLWETPQPEAPSPWQVADGGWAWRLPYDPDGEVPAADLPSPIPGLVTIGERDGRRLLLDLEAYGAVTLDGPTEHVDALLRSIAVELASDDELADSYVLTVGVDAGVVHLDRLTSMQSEGAIQTAERSASSVKEALRSSSAADTFAARVGSSVPIETTVVIAGPMDHDETRRLLSCCGARSGVAAVAASSSGAAPCHIQINEDGVARITPLDVEFIPAGVSRDTAQAVDELLEALEAEPDPIIGEEVLDIREHAPTPVSAGPSSNGHRPEGDLSTPGSDGENRPSELPVADQMLGDEDNPSDPLLLVRVLGKPSVPDRADLGRRELILTVYLACQNGPVATSAVQDALWGGKPVEAKTVWNLIGATRKALGDLDDGTPVLPAADRSRDGALRLASGVSTDLSLLRHFVERASRASSSEAIESLREALQLVTGPPFDAVGYDWAHRDQDVAEASALIEQATEHLVDLALEASLVDVARDAIVRGLRGLPGNELLYRCRMRVEHDAGNLAGVTAAYEELVTYLTDLETEPSPATTVLYHDLVRPARR